MNKSLLVSTAILCALPALANAQQCELYYKFDRGVGTAVANYGSASVSSTMVAATTSPWTTGKYGGALSGTANNSSTDYAYCDTGWKSAINGSFTVSWWCKERVAPGTALSYVFSGIGSFRCFTNGVAGSTLWVRAWGGADLKLPAVGATFQARAQAAAGVNVALVVDGTGLSAQWYVDGAAHGSPITITSAAAVALGNSFLIGKHTSNSSSFAYDVDEFRFCLRAAGAAEIKDWHNLPHAGTGPVGTPCGIKLAGKNAPTEGNALFSLEASGPANMRYLFVIGATPQPGFDMGIVFPGLKGCIWYTDFLVQFVGATASGLVSVPAPIPSGSAGAAVDVQILGFDPAAKALMSHALSVKVEKQ